MAEEPRDKPRRLDKDLLRFRPSHIQRFIYLIHCTLLPFSKFEIMSASKGYDYLFDVARNLSCDLEQRLYSQSSSTFFCFPVVHYNGKHLFEVLEVV